MEQEPQAQAVEPEVFYFCEGKQLIPLQYHHEAMAEIEEMNRQLREQNESVDSACAKLEAELKACVEAMKRALSAMCKSSDMEDGAVDDLDDAITQAQEAMK